MIVYREQKRRVRSSELLREIAKRLDGPILDLVVDFGEFESGVADALCPEADTVSLQLLQMREAAVCLARAFYACSRKSECEALWRSRFAAALAELRELPQDVVVSVQEGFAYYALYPQMYQETARRIAADHGCASAAVIGIRTIGAALSAVVCGVLRELGWEAHCWTVRPRGHPFNRSISVTAELEKAWLSIAGRLFLIVDEGPGLSGSSFAAVAGCLSRLGIPDERIIFLPSWIPEGSSFISEAARSRWVRHRKYHTSYEELWPVDSELDLSAGRWRHRSYADEEQYPAVQRQHERRKYLGATAQGLCLHKFAGLGRYSAGKLERAALLADAGFTPEPLGLENGFLISRYVEGNPCQPGDCRLLDRIASYVTYIRERAPASVPVPWLELRHMIEINVVETFGSQWDAQIRQLERMLPVIADQQTVAIDGRMLPHEWIETAEGFLKTDALDHHQDHFFPGCQDAAWDLAGAVVEFSWGQQERDALIATYRSYSNDRSIALRLPFYLVAYLAYRLGYCILARSAVADSPDAGRFELLERRYRNKLIAELSIYG